MVQVVVTTPPSSLLELVVSSFENTLLVRSTAPLENSEYIMVLSSDTALVSVNKSSTGSLDFLFVDVYPHIPERLHMR